MGRFMKIGIITYQKVNNYGADLQAYALQAKLRSLGYDAENIDYLHYKHPRFKATKKSKRIVPIPLKTRIKAFLFPFVSKLRNLKCQTFVKQREALFEQFEKDFLVLSEEFQTIDALYQKCPLYDVYISGSDQIWNPRSDTSLAPYFLDFAPKGAKCVSYASSFGVSELPGVTFACFKRLLKRFSAVSVREKSALRLVNSMSLGVETRHVVDPTLLLTANEWASVSRKPTNWSDTPFVLLYDLITSEAAVRLAYQWAQKLKCRIVRIGDGSYGPSEFVWLFANASAVITTSFHGTVFSILNSKSFYSVIPATMTNAGRIESLLTLLGLEKRLIHERDCEPKPDLLREIDYGAVNSQLETLRKDSLDFLVRAIEKPAQEVETKEPLETYAVWNANKDVRANSTSGGLFSIFAEYVISQGGLVFGAAFTDDFKAVHHISVSSMDELSKLMKSKYVWSDPQEAYQEALEALKTGKKVLFTGTPCQISVIRKLADVYADNLLTLDFVCHGTPKPEVWAAYVKELEEKYGSALTNFEFRNKDKGWNFQNIVYSFKSGKRCRVIPWNDSYFHGFSINAFLRAGCYQCAYANPNHPSDFTIADCWRVATSHPQYDDNKGTSLVLVNTPKAKKLWDILLKSGKICGGKYEFDLAQMRNSALMNPAPKPSCYSSFDKIFKETNSFNAAAQTYLSWKKCIKYTLMYIVKKIGWIYLKKRQ